MKTNKGFTTVELLVSFTLTAVIVFFLFEILFILKDLYVDTGIKTKLLTKQAVLAETLNDDITTKNILYVTKCDDADICLEFGFVDEDLAVGVNRKRLLIDRDTNNIKYGNVSNNLISGSEFGNIEVTYEKVITTNNTSTYDSILNISVPIYHRLIEKENFGFNVTYQYNSSVVSVSGLNMSDIVDADKKLYLIGGDDIKFTGIEYVDAGYYVIDDAGNIITSEEDQASATPIVKISGEIGDEPGKEYYRTYTIYDMNGNKMTEVERKITVVDANVRYDLTETTEEYIVPISGVYKIEAWGAAGGGTAIMRGKGGYSAGLITLNKGDILYINVGGKGTTAETSGVAAIGGYNGGGNSGISDANFASSGGGASDVRLNSSTLKARILVAGGGGGGGSRNDNEYSCNGGFGGGTTGTTGKCSADSYLGSAGTQTSGGAAATYSDKITIFPTSGTSGIGGAGAKYDNGTVTYAGGGGGGGYYGGGGGARYGGGGGGSGYCSSKFNECTTYLFDINNVSPVSFLSPDGINYESGHDGNGVVKISLKSIIVD